MRAGLWNIVFRFGHFLWHFCKLFGSFGSYSSIQQWKLENNIFQSKLKLILGWVREINFLVWALLDFYWLFFSLALAQSLGEGKIYYLDDSANQIRWGNSNGLVWSIFYLLCRKKIVMIHRLSLPLARGLV